jgi:hypothetical protein
MVARRIGILARALRRRSKHLGSTSISDRINKGVCRSFPGSTGEREGWTILESRDNFHERQVDRWMAHWDTFRSRPLPGITEAGEWLRENIPGQWTAGLMHGDYSLQQVMFRSGPIPALAAIVDWEMATIGDPGLGSLRG